MANVIAADSSAAPRTNLGTWTILIVSVAMLTVTAISVPHLIGRDGWATGEKLLYLALIGYLGASALHVFSLVTRQSGLIAGRRIAYARESLPAHRRHRHPLGRIRTRSAFEYLRDGSGFLLGGGSAARGGGVVV